MAPLWLDYIECSLNGNSKAPPQSFQKNDCFIPPTTASNSTSPYSVISNKCFDLWSLRASSARVCGIVSFVEWRIIRNNILYRSAPPGSGNNYNTINIMLMTPCPPFNSSLIQLMLVLSTMTSTFLVDLSLYMYCLYNTSSHVVAGQFKVHVLQADAFIPPSFCQSLFILHSSGKIQRSTSKQTE